MNATLPPGFWALAPLLFALFWMGICGVISLSGWHALAAHFRATDKPQGQSFPMKAPRSAARNIAAA